MAAIVVNENFLNPRPPESWAAFPGARSSRPHPSASRRRNLRARSVHASGQAAGGFRSASHLCRGFLSGWGCFDFLVARSNGPNWAHWMAKAIQSSVSRRNVSNATTLRQRQKNPTAFQQEALGQEIGCFTTYPKRMDDKQAKREPVGSGGSSPPDAHTKPAANAPGSSGRSKETNRFWLWQRVTAMSVGTYCARTPNQPPSRTQEGRLVGFWKCHPALAGKLDKGEMRPNLAGA